MRCKRLANADLHIWNRYAASALRLKRLFSQQATIAGNKVVKKIKISPEALDPEDVEMLEDMIVAAINEAGSMADADSEALMGKMAGGLGF